MSPTNPEMNERMRDASRARILEHALQLFAERGFDRTSVKLLAESAGISPGLVYHYFRSKDDVLRAIFEESVQQVQAAFAEAEAAPTPGERIERLIRASLQGVRENVRFWRLFNGMRLHSKYLELVGEEGMQWTASIRDTMERFFREAGAAEPAVEAGLLFALIDGVTQHFVFEPDRYPIQEMTERIVEAYRRSSRCEIFSQDANR
ncbi:MAG TPA: TetR/AcrR family transcriptional regulator [Longimicrobiaceae bacterium]|nr:TetR/AcrR family transcriptional regulator [Longimicrobiaceae bacterium]